MRSVVNQTVQPSILEPTGDSNKNLQIYGVDFEAELDDVTDYYVQFQEERQIQGVSVELVNYTFGVDGDSLRIAIQALWEVSPGVYDWIEVRALSCGLVDEVGCPVPPSGSISVIAEGSAPLPPDYTRIKCSYDCVKTSGDKPYVYLVFRTWV